MSIADARLVAKGVVSSEGAAPEVVIASEGNAVSSVMVSMAVESTDLGVVVVGL